MRRDSSDEPRQSAGSGRQPRRRPSRESDVEEDLFGATVRGERDGLRAVVGDHRVVAEEPDQLGHRAGVIRVAVHDEDASRADPATRTILPAACWPSSGGRVSSG